LVTGWDEKFDTISKNVSLASIRVEIISKALGKVYIIINMWQPYGDKNPLWDGLGEVGILNVRM
jgi:hypothetical protein